MTAEQIHRHGLIREGAPHDSHGALVDHYRLGVCGTGFGKCACGVLSPTSLPSGNARKRWHREHKAEVSA